MNSFDEALRGVLSERKYDRLTGRSVDIGEWIAGQFQRFIEFLMEHLNIRLPEWTQYNPRLYAVIFTAIGVLIVAAVTFAVVRVLLKRRRREADVYDLSDIFEELQQKQYTVNELFALSDENAHIRRYREAVRYRFIAALITLHERDVVRIRPSQTNAQLKAALNAAAPELSACFNETVDQYQHAWFGYKPVGSESYARFSSHVENLARAGGTV